MEGVKNICWGAEDIDGGGGVAVSSKVLKGGLKFCAGFQGAGSKLFHRNFSNFFKK